MADDAPILSASQDAVCLLLLDVRRRLLACPAALLCSRSAEGAALRDLLTDRGELSPLCQAAAEACLPPLDVNLAPAAIVTDDDLQGLGWGEALAWDGLLVDGIEAQIRRYLWAVDRLSGSAYCPTVGMAARERLISVTP